MNNSRSDEYICYFGFGSLVNRATLPTDCVEVFPATLKGWRRHWQARPSRSMSSPHLQLIAMLSIHRDPSCDINGVLVVDRMANLPVLEKREHAYNKVALSKSDLFIDNNEISKFGDIPIHTHVSPVVESTDKPLSILRSYLDVVMQGYYHHFGEPGIDHFLQSTAGFNLAIHEDRKRPVYSRHQLITTAETAIFDRILPNQYWRK